MSAINSSTSSRFERSIIRGIKHARRAVGRRIERLLIGRRPVTIISDDAWGGEFCRTFGGYNTTPLTGAFIPSDEYLAFLEHFSAPDVFHLQETETVDDYPVGRTPYATIHFPHCATWAEAARAYQRRAERVNRKRLFFKIDFGREGYTQADIERWNALALPHALALLPRDGRDDLDFSRVHQGLTVNKWICDGEKMFHLTRRVFDFHHWIRTDRLRYSLVNRLLNFLFWDALAPGEIARKWRLAPKPVEDREQDRPATESRRSRHRRRYSRAG